MSRPVGHGVHLVDANYPGDSDYTSSVSQTVGLTAQPAVPTVTVTPSLSSITAAQALTVTVAVSGGSGNPVPTGSSDVTPNQRELYLCAGDPQQRRCNHQHPHRIADVGRGHPDCQLYPRLQQLFQL